MKFWPNKIKPILRLKPVKVVESGISIKFNPHDIWVGLYHEKVWTYHETIYCISYYICIIPMIPIRIRYGTSKLFCFHCLRFTYQMDCENCSNRFCLRHCGTDNDSNWEMSFPNYPVCYHCDES